MPAYRGRHRLEFKAVITVGHVLIQQLPPPLRATLQVLKKLLLDLQVDFQRLMEILAPEKWKPLEVTHFVANYSPTQVSKGVV